VTDSPGSPEAAEPPEIEEVRRLLAEARHTEPMPDEVAGRMDDVLAGLTATTRPAASTSPVGAPGHASALEHDDRVVSLASHRRRRVAGMLVAAAAIVVGGVAVAQNLPSTSSSSADTAGSVGSDSAKQPRVRQSATPENLSGADARLETSPVLRNGRLVVHQRHFAADALTGRRLLQRKGADSVPPSPVACPSVPTDQGEVLRARYQQAPAALVYGPVTGGSQVVDLYVCGSPQPVRSATLPAP
jgi:hypothetical protein